MKTMQLAVCLVSFVAVVGVLFGLVPPMLNAPNTLLNALGAAVALSVIVAAVLVVHATLTHDKTTQDKKEQ